MATKIFRESLNGKYDGVSPEVLLEAGSISGGKNMRKVGGRGGWKVRKGTTLHNTTQISAHSVDSLHLFKHPRNLDYHFIAQIHSLLYDATNDPPASGSTFGTSLGIAVGTTPGFSALVGEKFAYADGSGRPLIWPGDNGIPLGFLVYDDSEDAYIDYSRKVRDKRTGTKAIILGAGTDKIYLITHELCEGFIIELGDSKNSAQVDLTVKSWQGGNWAGVDTLDASDIDSANATLAKDGTVTWVRSTSDKVRLISGIMGYVYEIGWTGALSGSVDLLEITTIEAASLLTNKWNGSYDWVIGARFYDASTDIYTEVLGKITNESTSQYIDLSEATVDDYLYLKTSLPATAFGIGIVPDYGNTKIGIAAVGTITMGGIATAEETFVIDDQTFTWKTSRGGTGEVTIGADASAAVTNIVAAVGLDLTSVVAVDGDGDTVVITAATAGTAANSMVFTEASTNMAMDGSDTLGGTTTGIDGGTIDQFEYWNGSAWAAITTNLVDTTKNAGRTASFAQTGVFSFDASAIAPQKRTLEGDSFAGYWYRLSWDTTLSADIRVYLIAFATFPEVLPACDGCIEFKDRLLTWGDPEFPNRFRYSASGFPDCFTGLDSDYTRGLGDMNKIISAHRFYNELVAFKKDSVWLIEGFNAPTFGVLKITDSVGLASPKTVHTVEIGYYGIGKEKEALTIIIWQAHDGVYIFDGRKPKKISLPVNQYFNPESSDCIAAEDIESLQAFIDEANNEYHLLLPAGELVYNYVLDEWYPLWVRNVSLTAALSLKGTDNRKYVYGGNSAGYIFRLEDGTVDKDVNNNDQEIDHSILSRAISVEGKEGVSVRFTLRRIWAELKAQSTSSIVTTVYKNLATIGEVQVVPSAMTMVSSGEGISVPGLDMSIQGCNCFKVEFSLNIANKEMEIWGFLYELEARGLLDR